MPRSDTQSDAIWLDSSAELPARCRELDQTPKIDRPDGQTGAADPQRVMGLDGPRGLLGPPGKNLIVTATPSPNAAKTATETATPPSAPAHDASKPKPQAPDHPA
jgi:hypothetical protein